MKTTRLSDRPRGDRDERVSDILTGALLLSVLLFARLLLNGPAPEAQRPTVITLKPAIMIQRETSVPQPTWTPAPTSAPQVIYIEAPTPEPQVIYVETAPVTAPAPAGASEAPPQAAEDWYSDIATPEPAFVAPLIGSDPNALACTGANGIVSPLCGGITNAQAMTAVAGR